MDEDRTAPLQIYYLPAIAFALIVACGVASIGYRNYLAKDASDAAKTACADHHTFVYGACLESFSQIKQNP
jgi:hypothetical protein